MNPTRITYNGEEHTAEEWSTIFGIDKDVLIYRKDYKLTATDDIFISELCKAKRRVFGS